MKLVLTCLAAAAIALPLSQAHAEAVDPIGDLIGQVVVKIEPLLNPFGLTATLYHLGGRGIHRRDSLGCEVVPMRTAAVDGVVVKRHSLLFIKETVGLPMPGGGVHDGYWYASDIGGGIHRGRIDLFTGEGSSSMRPMMHLNLATLTVSKVGEFSGCPSTAAAAAPVTAADFRPGQAQPGAVPASTQVASTQAAPAPGASAPPAQTRLTPAGR